MPTLGRRPAETDDAAAGAGAQDTPFGSHIENAYQYL
jgi:hypothetical protein